MNLLKKINYQIDINTVNQEKKIKFNDQNSLFLIYRQIFFLLFDLFGFFLTYKYIINKINRLKTLGLDFYSLIKLTFSAFIISTLLFFVVDICSRILNFVLLFSEKKRLIDETNPQNPGEIEIFKSGEEIFFEVIIPFFIELICSISKSIYNFLDKNVFSPLMEFANSLKEYLSKPDEVKKDFFDFCQKTYDKTKEICDKGFEILKKVYNFCIESLKFIWNFILQNVLIPIAGKINDLLEKNFQIKDTAWNNTPIKSIEKTIRINNQDYKIKCSLYKYKYKDKNTADYRLVLSYGEKKISRKFILNGKKQFEIVIGEETNTWAEDLILDSKNASLFKNLIDKSFANQCIRDELINSNHKQTEKQDQDQDPRWNSNFVLDSIYEYLVRFREKNQEINTASL